MWEKCCYGEDGGEGLNRRTTTNKVAPFNEANLELHMVKDTIIRCINELNNMKRIKTEGIYRVPGVNSSVAILFHKLLSEEKYMLDNVDTYDLAQALKRLFNQLSRPLLWYTNAEQIQRINTQSDDPKCVINTLKSLISCLPKDNSEICELLMRHLLQVSRLKQHNLMNTSNLANIFGPTLFRSSFEDILSQHDSGSVPTLVQDIKTLELLITHAQAIFPIHGHRKGVPYELIATESQSTAL